MMKSMLVFLSVICALYAPLATAFTPTFRPARVVPGVKPTHMRQTILRMSEEKPAAEGGAVEEAPVKGEAFYDDEVRFVQEK